MYRNRRNFQESTQLITISGTGKIVNIHDLQKRSCKSTMKSSCDATPHEASNSQLHSSYTDQKTYKEDQITHKMTDIGKSLSVSAKSFC